MGWIGAIVGYFIGGSTRVFGGGVIGALIGSVLEEKLKKSLMGARRDFRTGGAGRADADAEADGGQGTRQRRETVFLAAAAAMFAKMAKADGRVTPDEIACVEEAFVRLGLSREKREFCIGVFRRAKDDGVSIYAYASEFAASEPQTHVRELMYSLLWDLACADGEVSAHELAILRRITFHLGVRAACFLIEYARRMAFMGGGAQGGRYGGGGGRRRASGGASAQTDPLADAYAELGCSPSATDAELKAAYRDLAKKHHPDALRARGVPPELAEKATARMARVNAAWAEIRRARHIS